MGEHTRRVEMHIVAARAIVDILVFVDEEAGPAMRARLAPARIALLHIASEKLGQASRQLEAMH